MADLGSIFAGAVGGVGKGMEAVGNRIHAEEKAKTEHLKKMSLLEYADRMQRSRTTDQNTYTEGNVKEWGRGVRGEDGNYYSHGINTRGQQIEGARKQVANPDAISAKDQAALIKAKNTSKTETYKAQIEAQKRLSEINSNLFDVEKEIQAAKDNGLLGDNVVDTSRLEARAASLKKDAEVWTELVGRYEPKEIKEQRSAEAVARKKQDKENKAVAKKRSMAMTGATEEQYEFALGIPDNKANAEGLASDLIALAEGEDAPMEIQLIKLERPEFYAKISAAVAKLKTPAPPLTEAERDKLAREKDVKNSFLPRMPESKGQGIMPGWEDFTDY